MVLRQFEIHNIIFPWEKKLAKLATDENLKIGEGKIRSALKTLEEYGFIKSIGNMGSKITRNGKIS